ncbi:hypothetical protein TREMEDRAFT_32838 [Tremella mesenterica DSM 1558]|uniref:uncharacterized protein n=1 Tax=Tremella mesenterica (strain ATCC 24925 / CBS 8224 / DSM 1558 / NBRC 9311 / NRRL Y-6157 / RJB 2259-6 / UBC 559-6) TaxID=578456 RepID=UPI0003F490D4|nr:uncharacterized protein TREMEDRAFT_32838 [Tremella mesenterica DSM 1558]EIW67793.1 hypothetical protein TREMEDRAFT_32838 [Tremella mesenterica DSM 1558]
MRERKGFVGEQDVGIIGFAGPAGIKGVRGVIKQRFTDFMVYEVTPNGEVLHLKDITKPSEPRQEKRADAEKSDNGSAEIPEFHAELPTELHFPPSSQWPISTTQYLRKVFSDQSIIALRTLFIEGKVAPRRSDSGWGSRQAQCAPYSSLMRQVITTKEARTEAHKTIRELFKSAFETSTRQLEGEEGSRIIIKWAHGSSSQTRQQKPKQDDKKDKIKLPPYIHFTLHKTNRETQDCLSHLSRLLNCHPKDLTVCGTKDKRAVTVQRVCLRRGNNSHAGKTLVGVWKLINGITGRRNTEQAAITRRAERGCRIGDLEYSDQFLELGMLKGNQFVITLRNVQAEDTKSIDEVMTSLRDRGFINFYGMQRFGTSTVPTHITGLHILRGNWGAAVDSILSLREGEHPTCVAGRLAWLEDQDPVKALELMPRRSVAERAIWEHWVRHKQTEDKLGALGTIPRNLRTMYVHAYQSYIWNLVVSERMKLSDQPMVGDLVHANEMEGEQRFHHTQNVESHLEMKVVVRCGMICSETDEMEEETRINGEGKKQKWESSSSSEVKLLTAEELGSYTIFDVVMPLPGWNVEYPSGKIGQLYEDIMKADGLDLHRMRREQRDYSLPGSYRKLLTRPSQCSWTHIQYTDPDLALVQSDEDALLGLNIPATDDPNGRFRALKIELTLPASVYATMALREITREETSTWHQIGLTVNSEDQAYKGNVAVEGDDGLEVVQVEGEGEVMEVV